MHSSRFKSCSLLFLAVFLSVLGQGKILDKDLAVKDCRQILKQTGIDYRVGSCSKAPSMVGKGIIVNDTVFAKSGVSDECYAYLCGQADMDSDGLSETFALSFWRLRWQMDSHPFKRKLETCS